MRTLLAFDFDWSLLEENSDTFVIRELGADEIYAASKGMPWTQRMDHCLTEAARQLGSSPDDIRAALHRAPMHPALAELLRDAAAAAPEGSGGSGGGDGGGSEGGSGGGSGGGDGGGSEGGSGGGSDGGSDGGSIDTVILSDANTVYIDTILQHHGLVGTVLEVHTNPAEWQQGALRVSPYHSRPHGCPHCPSNLCKGLVLREFLERQAGRGWGYGRVLYVGDGRGDFCPSTLLLHGCGSQNAGSSRNSGGSDSGGSPSPGAATGHAGAAAAAAAVSGGSDGGGSPGAAMAQAEGAAPPPCGSRVNVIFARTEYPDGLPCSLWVMLRTEQPPDTSGGSSGGGSSDKAAAGAPGPAGAAAAADTAGAGAGAGAAEGGVVGWAKPEQLAALLRRELQLE